jgi:ribose transport system substrate-binding protein
MKGVVLLCCLSIACQKSTKKQIAVIPKATANLFWQSVHAGAVKGAWESDVDIIWEGPASETDIAGEMQIMETMIDRHVDAIVVAPSDQTAFKITVNRAADAGIPVVIFDSGVATDRYVTFVATDNYLGGKMGADRLGAILHGKGKIVMVDTVPGSASTVAREDGFHYELREKFPQIQIVDERFGMSTIAQSLTVTENMLSAHPDIDGIFASNEPGSEGAAQALRDRGLHNIKLVGFDSSPILIELLKQHWIDSLVIQDPFKVGETAVLEAAKAIRGQPTRKHIFLPPRIVDLTNMDEPDVHAQLFPDLRKYLGPSEF